MTGVTKNKRVNVTPQGFVKILFALAVIHIAFLPLRINAVLYPVRIAAILVIFLLGVLILARIKTRVEFWMFFSFLIIGFIIVGNFVAYSIPITMDNLLSVLCVLCLLLLVYVSDKIEINKVLIDFIYWCSILMAFIMLAYSRTSYAHWNGEREHIHLTLGIENPNLTAIILFLIYAMLVITMRGRKRILVPVLLEAALLWMIWLTNSRMILVAALVLLLPTLTRKKNLKPIPMWVVRCICALPFLFVPVYLALYKIIGDFQILNKSFFSGRQDLFVAYLSCINTVPSFLFGNLRDAALQNAHNGPLAVVTSLGLLGSVAYFYIFLKSIEKACKKAESPVAITSIIVVLACFVHACGEAALFLGGFPMITFMFVVFLLANTSKNVA